MIYDLVDFDVYLKRHVIEVNLIAAALLAKAMLSAMIERRSSKGEKGRSAHRATKAGLSSLTEDVAAEVKQRGIDVNCVCPAGVDTEAYRNAFNTRGREDNPKLFLASEAVSAITGGAIDAFNDTNPLFAQRSRFHDAHIPRHQIRPR